MSTAAGVFNIGGRSSADTGGSFGRPSAWVIGTVSAILVILLIADRLYHPDNFRIRDIVITGDLSRADADRVGAIVQGHLDGNYFTVGLPELNSRIREVPWIFSSSIRRRWPSSLIVDLEEIQPVARWGDTGWLNVTGDPVAVPESADQRDFPGLPRLSGPSGEERHVWNTFRQWSDRFALVGLSLDALRLDASRLWYLELSLGALTMNRDQQGRNLPGSSALMVVEEQDSMARIQRFVKVLDQHLIMYFASMRHIDLRYPNGFAIRWVDGQPEAIFRERDGMVGPGQDESGIN